MKKNDSKNSAKFLKKFGLIKYDLRKKLNSQQKRRVAALSDQYARELKDPSAYAILRVTKKQARIMAGLGVDLKYGHAVIPLRPNETAKISRNNLIKTNKKRKKQTIIPLIDGPEIIKFLEKKLLSGEKPNTTITCRMTGSGIWQRQFTTYADLLKYIADSWPTKDPNRADKNELIENLKLIRLGDATKARRKEYYKAVNVNKRRTLARKKKRALIKKKLKTRSVKNAKRKRNK